MINFHIHKMMLRKTIIAAQPRVWDFRYKVELSPAILARIRMHTRTIITIPAGSILYKKGGFT